MNPSRNRESAKGKQLMDIDPDIPQDKLPMWTQSFEEIS